MTRRSVMGACIWMPLSLWAMIRKEEFPVKTMTIHRASERGVAEHGWLHSRFSFSFADYINRHRMGFGVLRVINDDIIEPSKGFGMHPHRDMEIITIVTEGTVAHKDSEGNAGVTQAGQIQYMSAGTGIFHSEYNASDDEVLALFQIWIQPDQKGLPPRYDQRDFADYDDRNRWVTLVAPDGRENAMPIHQNAFILTTRMDAGIQMHSTPMVAGNGRLLFVVEGELEVAGEHLKARDEIQITSDEHVTIRALTDARVLLFDIVM